MAPEFAELLMTVPEADRTGRVFNPKAKRMHGEGLTANRVCVLCSKIGEKAGVKVNTDPKTGKVKFASCHDLRRSFGERWTSRIMPEVLKELMRHSSVETTLKYYVGRNAQTTADVLWEAHKKATEGNTSGNTAPYQAGESDSTSAETPCKTKG